MVIKLIVGIITQMAIFGGLLFWPAGTLRWWRAWVFLGLVLVAGAATLVSLFPGHRAVLEERYRPPIQKGQPLGDKILVVLFIAMFLGVIAFIPLDVFQFHLFGRPGTFVSTLGLVAFAVGWWIMSLALRENAFAALVVRHQTERGHAVVDTGVYGRVRHPMYAGAILLLIGMPLWLESYAAALLAGAPIGTLVLRILLEEEFLRRELKGYNAYTARVRYRLIPFLW